MGGGVLGESSVAAGELPQSSPGVSCVSAVLQVVDGVDVLTGMSYTLKSAPDTALFLLGVRGNEDAGAMTGFEYTGRMRSGEHISIKSALARN
jgi:hypothetical protein